MNIWENAVITDKGISLLAKVTAGNSLQITRAVTGNGYVSPASLVRQTAVSGVQQSLTFRPVSYPETGKCAMPCRLTNDSLGTGYTATQVGIYANDTDDGEILFFIAQAASGSGTVVPSAAEMPGYSAEWTFYFQYGQADGVEVTVDPSGVATMEQVEEVREIAEASVFYSKSGRAIVIEDAAHAPLVEMNFYGRSSQAEGTPAPDNVIDVESAGDDGSIVLSVYGKNLLNLGDIAHSDCTVLDATAGKVQAAIENSYFALMQTTRYCNFIRNNQGLPLTFSVNNAHGHQLSILITGTREDGGTYQEASSAPGANYVTIVPNGFTTVTLLELRFGRSSTTYTDTATIYTGLQLSVGSMATEFEPYSVQNLTLDTSYGLHGIPVTSGGNFTDSDGHQWICDEIDLARGVYIQRVCRADLATADIQVYEYKGTNRFAATASNIKTATSSGVGYCNAFKVSMAPVIDNDQDNTISAYEAGNGVYWRCDQCASVSEMKALAEELGIFFIFPYKVPVETALPASVVAAFREIYANNPITTILNEESVEMKAGYIRAKDEAAYRMLLNQSKKPVATQITLVAANWTGDQEPWYQTIVDDRITAGTKIDLSASESVVAQMLNDGTTMIFAKNNNGIAQAVAFGSKPTSDITLQATFEEVTLV